MTLIELFEERADRGIPRGAVAVWAAAHEQLNNEPQPRPQGSVTGLRVALAFSAAALAMFVGIRITAFGPDDTQVTPIADEAENTTEAKPAPILIDGMTLKAVMDPWTDSEREATTFTTGGGASGDVISTGVYASASSGFSGPVVGIDTLEGGGFAPWSANLTAEELSSLTSEVVRDGDSWELPDDGVLVEVARFEDDSERFVTDGWQFDFRSGPDGATLQAEEDSSVWVWLGRLLRFRSVDEGLTVAPIDVLGTDGLIVDDNAVWEDDGFVYRLTANEIQGDTSFGRPVETVIDRLEVVERAEWDTAIERAQQGSVWGGAEAVAALLGLVVWLLTAKKVADHNPRHAVLAAGLGLVGVAVWWAFAPMLWLAVGLLIISLAAFGWVRTTSSQSAPSSSAADPTKHRRLRLAAVLAAVVLILVVLAFTVSSSDTGPVIEGIGATGTQPN